MKMEDDVMNNFGVVLPDFLLTILSLLSAMDPIPRYEKTARILKRSISGFGNSKPRSSNNFSYCLLSITIVA